MSQVGTKELYYRYKHCKEHTKLLMADPPWMRKMFLSQKLAAAIQNEQSDELKRIKEVLRNEAERKEWQGNIGLPRRTGRVQSPLLM